MGTDVILNAAPNSAEMPFDPDLDEDIDAEFLNLPVRPDFPRSP
jgi:hypothetical protein